MATSVPPVLAPDRPGYAIVLAGGSGRRLGLVDKPALLTGTLTLLEVALAAVAPARTVVVGPHRDLPDDVLQAREEPPGGGPAAALVTGLIALIGESAGFGESDLVAVLAADLPRIGHQAVDRLAAAVRSQHTDGAVLVDPAGRSQYLAGVWRLTALIGAARSRRSWHDARVSDLLGSLTTARVPADLATTADVDTAADLLEWGVLPAETGESPRTIPGSTGPQAMME